MTKLLHFQRLGSGQTAFCQASATLFRETLPGSAYIATSAKIGGSKVAHLVHASHYMFHLPFHDATSLTDNTPGTFVAGILTNKESLFCEKATPYTGVGLPWLLFAVVFL